MRAQAESACEALIAYEALIHGLGLETWKGGENARELREANQRKQSTYFDLSPSQIFGYQITHTHTPEHLLSLAIEVKALDPLSFVMSSASSCPQAATRLVETTLVRDWGTALL